MASEAIFELGEGVGGSGDGAYTLNMLCLGAGAPHLFRAYGPTHSSRGEDPDVQIVAYPGILDPRNYLSLCPDSILTLITIKDKAEIIR